ncbi:MULTISPECIES: bifunctional UDP-N-acetylglucosamine diphosphorylase/glucosamine-1-phosphate N-acetyltransferase GlmU [unclassified Helicobacter]|uniref:bifunctional UDP-N-acetylglucosamine diphosphorylase/glucosamine-1-phosphate N-acetyltransferase GlmU n=1 Tax=unclassified Helicobacter TaxID=2593540 RepID=UPI000CF0A06F|nr:MULTISPECIES: bifunctional UDP-N-acetylglucosamine diphosphorylase/glucosamine-1-phosphate N-acetyltransferase GlmU [unclassified Helicobacter]
MKSSIVIMAAGKGTRMCSQTPKFLHKICGKPLGFYVIAEALKVSDDIHIVLAHQADLIKQQILENFNSSSIHFHFQDLENFPGTGGALMDRGSQRFFEVKYERVLILNGDMPLVTEIQMRDLLQVDSEIVLSVIKLEDPSGYGRVLIKDNHVLGIVEEKDCNDIQKKINTVNAGVYVVKKQILGEFLPSLKNFNAQKEYYLTDLVSFGVTKGLKITPVFSRSDAFFGVNSRVDLAIAQDKMLDRIRKNAMLKGVTMHLPHTIYIESDVEFEGECELQEGVRITGKSRIVQSLIKSHSVIESSEVISSDIGPLAHIRPNSFMKDTHIGNFVEVKSSTLNGVKAGHLSYLGDCEIQQGSNIGAGVITCNYDGVRKHQTFIGENVFVGSDTQLVAPLRIESNVLIGAGSTVTKDCKEGDLVLSRTSQRNVPRGFFKFFNKV